MVVEPLGKIFLDVIRPAVVDLAGHVILLAEADGLIDARQSCVQVAVSIVKVMRGVVDTKKGSEAANFLQARNIAHGTIEHDAIARLGINRVAEVTADGRGNPA